MVLAETLKIAEEAPTKSEMHMESGYRIPYVAPYKCAKTKKTTEDYDGLINGIIRRKFCETDENEQDKWDGVRELCQVLDNAIFIENDEAMFKNKRTLEIGFSTGLPSAFAFSHGASTVALHCNNRNTLHSFIRPTLSRSNVSRNCTKLSCGDYEVCKRTLSAQKYDVILAPELVYTDEVEFDVIHDVLDAALAPNGIILFSARPYYSDCSGSLPTFLDLVKLKGIFDAHIRWTASNSDSDARKIIQMNRVIR